MNLSTSKIFMLIQRKRFRMQYLISNVTCIIIILLQIHLDTFVLTEGVQCPQCTSFALNMFVILLVQHQQFLFNPSGVLNQLKKIHISRRKKNHLLFLQMILVRTMTTFLAMTILKKEGENPIIPGFIFMKLC
jgi:hypothetical protein